ncbi:hypothetical protein M422DRAFT_37243 [Sphaerobolus stellatus SS14]|uniref:Protein kinase domain-containing protein n=1 Tax=Sphaerobolus stellatus (strain SS14) TaxID=990650 RepID=A0A0C9UTJ5_SPHS4|nr:hypothetical protein M422DRAFT_37243 [Sphaerobolus stellatus SS14]
MAETRPPPYLRTWLLTSVEIYNELEEQRLIVVDSSEAWKHFEPLVNSKGYEICYYCPASEDYTPKVARPLCDLDTRLGDPFRPARHGPFVHHSPEGFDEEYENSPNAWQISPPTLTYAYDRLKRIVDRNDSEEIRILEYLNNEQLRSCPENHTIPLIERIASNEGWDFLVMPAWRLSWSGRRVFKFWQVDDYFELLIQSFEGLAFMHQHGIAHRDISLGNIAFNDDMTFGAHDNPFRLETHPIVSAWNFKLAYLDFGFSIQFDVKTDPNTWTLNGTKGTVDFHSPENWAADRTGIPYQALPADVFSLGKLWQLVLGEEEEKIEEIRTIPYVQEAIKIKYSVFASDVLKEHVLELKDLLRQTVEDDPAARPTAAQALERLRRLRQQIPSHVRFAPAEGYPDNVVTIKPGRWYRIDDDEYHRHVISI